MIDGLFSMPATRSLTSILLLLATLAITACNDAPTDLGSDLIPGTDSLYAASSITMPALISGTSTELARAPIFNNTYVLFGRTSDSEARVFVEFINVPRLGSADSFTVVQADLMMHPQAYLYGDTNSRTLAMAGYELQRIWTPTSTWDTIWAADGSTTYYSTASERVCTFSKDLTSTDTIVAVPLDVTAAKRWLVKGADSVLRKELYGIVLLPTEGASIRQFRNTNGANQIMKMRVIHKRIDNDTLDTTFVESAVACFVNAPPVPANELYAQGAMVYRTKIDIDLSALPANAAIMQATLRVAMDAGASRAGTLGLDEILRMTYAPADGSTPLGLAVRGDDSTKVFAFNNLASLVQDMMRNGRKGTLKIGPDGSSEYWRMNRLRLHPMSADSTLRPRLHVIYTVPTVIK